VTLTATGPGGSNSASIGFSVSDPAQAPVAAFSPNPATGITGQPVQFNNQTTERAVSVADSRSLRPLLILAGRTGCGRRDRHDCFPCLRSDDSLERALERSKNTLAPDHSRLGVAE
jgi:hypothetical protein